MDQSDVKDLVATVVLFLCGLAAGGLFVGVMYKARVIEAEAETLLAKTDLQAVVMSGVRENTRISRALAVEDQMRQEAFSMAQEELIPLPCTSVDWERVEEFNLAIAAGDSAE